MAIKLSVIRTAMNWQKMPLESCNQWTSLDQERIPGERHKSEEMIQI